MERKDALNGGQFVAYQTMSSVLSGEEGGTSRALYLVRGESMNQKSNRSFLSVAFPGLLAFVSLLTMVYGFFGEGSLIGIGFVLFATSIVIGVSWYGAETSVMDQAVAQQEPSIKTYQAA
jgi:hypothetical protein